MTMRKNKVPKEIEKPYREVTVGDDCHGEGGLDIPINSRSLGSFIQQDSIKERKRWDWKKGEMVTEKESVVAAARDSQMTLRHRPVVSGRNLRKRDGDDDDDNVGMAATSCWGGPRYK